MSTEEPTDPSMLDLNHTVSVEREVLERLKQSELLQHVMKLPKLYQEVLYLYYYLDLSTPEIAEATQSPEGTVRTRLHRARELLGQELKKDEGFIHERS
jgi:RNA polymerase sigma-70 factor (ECF subfamily)